MLLSPICRLLAIPTLARMVMPERSDPDRIEAVPAAAPPGTDPQQPRIGLSRGAGRKVAVRELAVRERRRPKSVQHGGRGVLRGLGIRSNAFADHSICN